MTDWENKISSCFKRSANTTHSPTVYSQALLEANCFNPQLLNYGLIDNDAAIIPEQILKANESYFNSLKSFRLAVTSEDPA